MLQHDASATYAHDNGGAICWLHGSNETSEAGTAARITIVAHVLFVSIVCVTYYVGMDVIFVSTG